MNKALRDAEANERAHFETNKQLNNNKRTTKTNKLQRDVKELRSNLHDTSNKLRYAEQRINFGRERSNDNKAIKHLLCKEKTMRDKLDYLENKSQCEDLSSDRGSLGG